MTILVGVLCEDGVIIGADSSSTFGIGQFRTVEQPCKKIFVLNGSVIVAGTGHVGLNQRFCKIVEDCFRDSSFLKQHPIEKAKILTIKGKADFQSTGAPFAGQYGALLAFAQNSKLYLVEFATDTFQPEFKETIWFVSMGSGQPIADPFLGLMRRTFSSKGPPKTPTGLFITTWTLHHTCEVNPGGIKEPIDLATLVLSDGKEIAKVLEKEMVEEHWENVQSAYDYLAAFSKEQQPEKSNGYIHSIPEPPLT